MKALEQLTSMGLRNINHAKSALPAALVLKVSKSETKGYVHALPEQKTSSLANKDHCPGALKGA
eukprot:366772-Amphidinium_carterae.2